MGLMPFKTIYDRNSQKMVFPMSQEIVFTNNKTDKTFSFNVVMNQSRHTSLYYDRSWSTQIDSALYKESEQYDVFVNFYYETQPNTTKETCRGESTTSRYMTLDTSQWVCTGSSNTSLEMIDITTVCDGISDCCDSSDEALALCKPEFSYFRKFTDMAVVTYIILGIIVFVVCKIFYYFLVQKDLIATKFVPNQNTNKHKKKILKLSKDILSICTDVEKQNDSLKEPLKGRNLRMVRRIFRPCQNEEKRRSILQILFTLSFNLRFEKTIQKIFDELVEMEIKVHGTKGDAVCCMRFYKTQDSYLSKFIKDEIERNDFFNKVGEKITRCRHRFDYASWTIYFVVIIKIFLVTWNMGMFFYDIVKDVVTLNLLVHINTNILKDEDLRNRFATVGGINFKVIIIYLCVVFTVSLFGVFWRISKRRCVLSNHGTSKLESRAMLIFPIHFLYLQKFTSDINLRFLERKLRHLFRKTELYQENQMASDLVKMSKEFEELHRKLYHSNLLEREAQIIQTVFERVPQTVVQLIFLILMKKYKRIALLFSAYFGVSAETIVILSSFASTLSITNSVYKYLHAKEFPFSPNILGTIVQYLAIIILVVPKLSLISVALLNLFYIYPMIYYINLTLVLFYDKIVSDLRDANCFDFLLRSIVPAFYSSSKAHSENRFIRVYLFLQKKFGSVTNTVTLSLTTLMVYGLIAAMLRTTIFTYNLDKQYRANDETSKCEINSTITQGLSDGHYDTQNNLERIFLVDSLFKFPVYYVGVYFVAIVLYIVLSYVYGIFFDPWNIITRYGKRKDGVDQDTLSNDIAIALQLGPKIEEPNEAIDNNVNQADGKTENVQKRDSEAVTITLKQNLHQKTEVEDHLPQKNVHPTKLEDIGQRRRGTNDIPKEV